MAEEEESQEQKGGGSKTMLFVILGAVLLLIIVGVVVIMLMGGGHDEEEAAPTKTEKQAARPKAGGASASSSSLMNIGPTIPVVTSKEPLIINLSTQGRDAYLQVSVSIALDDVKLQPEVEKKIDPIKSVVIEVFSSKTPEELSTIKGKNRTLEEMRTRINEFLVDGEVTNVFITSFTIQRG